jgi:SAM-dependent methyltransferase
VTAELFDEELRARRVERALRRGPVLFVHERAVEDIAERLTEVRRSFGSALLVSAPDPASLRQFAEGAEVAPDPRRDFPSASFDLCVVIGGLDTINDLPGTLRRIGTWLKPDGLLLGVIPGGNTLPQLRGAMRAADAVAGAAAPHAHPRIEASALGHLLSGTGFVMPVVDIDRVRVAYPSLLSLVSDLRGMGATNALRSRPRFISRAALAAAEAHFRAAGEGGRTIETFELLHFAAWTPNQG